MNTPWPTRPDGTNKTIGEMTPLEKKIQLKQSCARIQAEFDAPGFKERFAEAMKGIL